METSQIMQFKIGEKGIKSIKNEYSLWSFLMVGIFLLILCFDGKSTFTINGINQPSIYGYLINVVSVLILISICTYFQRKNIDGIYKNYIFTIESNAVKKTAYNSQKRVTMNISAIYEIRRSYNGGLFLKSNSKPKILFIPYQIENRDELETILKSLGPKFVAGPYKFHSRYIKELFSLFSVLLAVDFCNTNVYSSVLISILLITFLMTMFLLSIKNRRLTKSSINIVFNLLIFSLTTIVLFRLAYILLL